MFRNWLQTHFEIVEDRLLIGFGRGDFLELHCAAVALNFEMKGKRFAFNGYPMSISTNLYQVKYT
jgi:hypothetical protein